MTARLCSEPGCPNPVNARGLCSTHYKRRGRDGTLPPPIQLKRGGHCSIEGCGRPHSGHGLCKTHLARQRTGRDLLAPIETGARWAIGTRRLVEDLEWLAGTDTPESIAVRLGYRDWSTLADRLRRIDRPDLVAAIVARRELPKSPWAVAS